MSIKYSASPHPIGTLSTPALVEKAAGKGLTSDLLHHELADRRTSGIEAIIDIEEYNVLNGHLGTDEVGSRLRRLRAGVV